MDIVGFYGVERLQSPFKLANTYKNLKLYMKQDISKALVSHDLYNYKFRSLYWLRKPLDRIVNNKYGDKFKAHYKETISALEKFDGLSVQEAAFKVQYVIFYYRALKYGDVELVNKIENVYRAILKDYLRHRLKNIIRTAINNGVNPLIVKSYISRNQEAVRVLNNISTDEDWDIAYNFIKNLEDKVLLLSNISLKKIYKS